MHPQFHTLILIVTSFIFGNFSTVVFAQETAITRSVLRAVTRPKCLPQQPTLLGNWHHAPAAPTTALDASTLSYCPPTSSVPATEKTGVSLADAKGKVTGRHSIVPSAMTILGSDAFRTKQQEMLGALRQADTAKYTQEYLTPNERAYWAEEREKLVRTWNLEEPATPQQLYQYLTHEVPADTFHDLQHQYINYVETAQKANHEIMAKVVYSSLINEGRRFSLMETIRINKIITDQRFQLLSLRNAFVKDPYLLNQQKYWDKVFGAFNPLLKGLLIKLNIPRPDKRVYDYHEFTLANPDHSTPYLPGSQSLIKGEAEEDDDYDDYEDGYDSYGRPMPLEQRAAQRAAEQAHFQRMMAFTDEAEELLPFIPENLHIAFINDDANPRLNFESWAKRGLLGKGATVETFKEGRSFMQRLKQGTHYDLVITDLLVPKGGIDMMEELREIDPFLTVIASSKFYPGDGDTIKTEDGKEVITAEDYFYAGIDGYLWYNNNLDAGSYGFVQYLRSMKNYYYYKNLHGWSR